MALIEGARFGHVNLTGADWRRLAAFYGDLFGCEIVPPERDYSGPDLEAATQVPGAHLTGAHLRLPGHGSDGPTLEIYQFESGPDGLSPAVNRPGYRVHAAQEGWGYVRDFFGRHLGVPKA